MELIKNGGKSSFSSTKRIGHLTKKTLLHLYTYQTVIIQSVIIIPVGLPFLSSPSQGLPADLAFLSSPLQVPPAALAFLSSPLQVPPADLAFLSSPLQVPPAALAFLPSLLQVPSQVSIDVNQRNQCMQIKLEQCTNIVTCRLYT